MAAKRSDKNRWESQYGGGYIRTAQYLVERICQRKADQEKRGRLPHFFWNLDNWSNFYKQQINFASKLIKEFGEGPLMRAFSRNDTSWCFSMAGPKFRAAVYEEYQRELKVVPQEQQLEQEKVVGPVVPQEAPKHTVTATKKNILNKLDEI